MRANNGVAAYWVRGGRGPNEEACKMFYRKLKKIIIFKSNFSSFAKFIQFNEHIAIFSKFL